MHTEENLNKPKRKRMGKPGEQVAVNRTYHNNMQLFEDPAGEYYPVVSPITNPTLIRGEYHPVGNLLQYPRAWGRKWAATKLLEHKIKVQQDILATAQVELGKLERCLASVKEWSDND